ncbi:MAG: hypothetical protein AAB692_05100 [Patescibacteria group bacterium]
MSLNFALFVVFTASWLGQPQLMSRGYRKAALAAAWVQLLSGAAYAGLVVQAAVFAPNVENVFYAALWALFAFWALRNLLRFR